MSDNNKEGIPPTRENVSIENHWTTTTPEGNLNIINNQSAENSLNSDINISKETHSGTKSNGISSVGLEEELRENVLATNSGMNDFPETESCGENEKVEGGYKLSLSKPCQPCLDIKEQMDSILYCIECKKYLCEKCVAKHSGVKLTKTHSLVSKEMSDTSDKVVQINKKEECPVHMNEYIEWFCISDDKLCCKICKFTEHRRCSCVVAIDNAIDTGKIESVVQNIKKTQANLNDEIDKKERLIKHLEEDRNESLLVLESIANDTEKKFQSLKNSLKKENRKIESKYSTETEPIGTDIENCSKIIDNLDATIKKLQKENVCMEYKFVQMKKAEKQLKAVQRTTSNSTSAPLCTPIGYERDKLFDQKLNAFDRFGYFDNEKHVYKVLKPQKIKITQGYEKVTLVFAILVVDCDTLLITDWTNCAVKLIDLNKNAVRSKLQLSGCPYGICKLEQNEKFAVTVRYNQEVTFIKMGGKDVAIDETKSFRTGENCNGIACCNSRLLIACGGIVAENEGPGHIRIFDMNGKLLETVMTDTNGRVLVSVPYNIKLLPGGKNAFITDFENLLQINLTNNALEKVANMSISPYYASICFDPYDRTIIAEPRSKSIKLVSSDCQRVEQIIPDLPTEPLAIATDNKKLKLFVGLQKSEDLLCFQMEIIKWDKQPKF